MSAYVFTFGCGQKHAGHFVRIAGKTADEARDRMVALFGNEWCTQYTEEEWSHWTDLAYAEGIPVETEMELSGILKRFKRI